MIDTEKTEYTGAGVYVAVLDTGLATNWRAYFPEERIATELGRGFVDKGIMKEDRTGVYVPNVVESSDFHGDHPHGTHVSSTVIGYSIRGTYIDGVAPGATIIPVKVLETYPALQATFGTDAAVAAGIEYVVVCVFFRAEITNAGLHRDISPVAFYPADYDKIFSGIKSNGLLASAIHPLGQFCGSA